MTRRELWQTGLNTWYDLPGGFIDIAEDRWSDQRKHFKLYDSSFALAKLLYLLGIEPRE